MSLTSTEIPWTLPARPFASSHSHLLVQRLKNQRQVYRDRNHSRNNNRADRPDIPRPETIESGPELFDACFYSSLHNITLSKESYQDAVKPLSSQMAIMIFLSSDLLSSIGVCTLS